MKQKLFLIGLVIVLIITNVTFKIKENKTSNLKLSYFMSKAYGDEENGLYWTRVFCECHVGGIKLPDFSSFCGMTWWCDCGNDLEYCYDHGGCTPICSCPD
jgi:hypothetical protein